MRNSIAQDAAAEVFTNTSIYRIEITIPPEGVKALRTVPRQYVTGALREGSNTFAKVGIHLKGSVGSFRSIDGKPAFTISFDKFVADQRFRSLRKIHLNNSVEDPSYMNELIGSDTFLAAKLPAPRVSHALVELNGRRLGLYVLKEGFTEDFLALHFRHATGNLYDLAPGGHDVNEPMEKALGANPEDRSDLDALAATIEEPDLAQRWAKLPRTLDLERFLSFMGVEIMLGHRDGYCLARNNFRIYHDVDSNRLVFLPHGMDVLFGNARAAIEPRMNGLAGRAVMETPEGRRAYRTRLALLFTNVFDVPRMHSRIDRTLTGLRSVLPRDEAAALDREAVALKERIVARARELKTQLAQPPLELARFVDDIAKVSGWQPFDVPDGGGLTHTNAPDGRLALAIQAGPVTAASWRTKVLLPPGRYRFEGAIKTSGIAALPFGKNHGASVRVSGVPGVRPAGLVGEQPWKALQVTFETTAREQEVDLICDLRASRGAAWFDSESLRLVRLK
ncbi:MAG TPA: CotH kinase family protein [Candidatus Limnocylindria bacterium]|nr:CotH kinase family protein [Candidatus Limnocylindria bacterium]